MDEFWPAVIGAAVPVALGFFAATRRFGRLEGTVSTLETNYSRIDSRLESLATDIRNQHKETSDSLSVVLEKLNGVEVRLVDRISRVEGLLEAPRRETPST